MSNEWNMIDIKSGSFGDSDHDEEKPLLELQNTRNSPTNKPPITIKNKTLFKSIPKKRERSSSLGGKRRVNYVISGSGMIEQKRNKRLKIENNNFVRIKFNHLNKRQKSNNNKLNIKNLKYLFFIFIMIFCIVTLFSFYLCLKRIEEIKFYENQMITNSTTVSFPPNIRFMCKYWIKKKVVDIPEYCNSLQHKHS
jgi:hypothetical protein